MKIAFFSLTVVVVVCGCSKPGDQAGPQKQQAAKTIECPKPIDPSRIVLIEPAERKEKLQIGAEVATNLAARNFTTLEEMASGYRSSKACYGDGVWKLSSFYAGLYPGKEKSDAEWKTSLDALRAWVQADPKSITARVGLAEALVAYGWKARGSGYADTVTENGWKLLGERLTEAAQVLQHAAALQQKCPQSWNVLLRAGLGLGFPKPQYESIFQKAVAFEPGYIEYYYKMSYYLLPRWYGKRGDTAAFMQRAADKVGGDEGDVLYARLAWFVQGLEANIFIDYNVSWPRADKGFQIIEKRFPNSLLVQNARAYIAVMGCEKTLAPRTLVEKLNGRIDPAAWSSKENFIELTRNLYPGQS